jgi:hypothetical protein
VKRPAIGNMMETIIHESVRETNDAAMQRRKEERNRGRGGERKPCKCGKKTPKDIEG